MNKTASESYQPSNSTATVPYSPHHAAVPGMPSSTVPTSSSGFHVFRASNRFVPMAPRNRMIPVPATTQPAPAMQPPQRPYQPRLSTRNSQSNTVPAVQLNPEIANAIARLATRAYPHYSMYPLNPRFPPTTNPVQPHLPPTSLPAHPVFVYYGRDLSSPTLRLPTDFNFRPLFERNVEGDMSDEGFGVGVRVAEAVRGEVGEAERECLRGVLGGY